MSAPVVHAANEAGAALCRFLPTALVAHEEDDLDVTCRACKRKLGHFGPPGLRATNGFAQWPIVRVSKVWCFKDQVVIEYDVEDGWFPVDHYNPDKPCPGPHGELYAASS